jgi:hypothetical protein
MILLLYSVAACLANLHTAVCSESSTTYRTGPAVFTYFPNSWLHPDLVTPSPPDAEQEACYTSWSSYYKTRRSPGQQQTIRLENATSTSVIVWETIKSYGSNFTYTECDGIPRLRFIGTPTVSSTSFVTVTMESDETKWDLRYNRTDFSMPTCKRLNPSHCRKIFAWAEVGGPGYGTSQSLNFPKEFQDVCPVYFGCNTLLDEVILFYWPDNMVDRNICDSDGRGHFTTKPWAAKRGSVVVTDAITFRGQDLYVRSINGENWKSAHLTSVDTEFYNALFWRKNQQKENDYFESSVMKGDFTFISPTVYLAHRTIFHDLIFEPVELGRGFRKRKFIRTEGIIPLHATDVFSLRPIQTMGGIQYANLVANGSFHGTLNKNGQSERYETRPFNFGDLQDPVPASVYYDARLLDCWGQQSHCKTITDDSYRPKLHIAASIWKSVFNGYQCGDPFLVDPPVSLNLIDEASLKDAEISTRYPTLTSSRAMPTAGRPGENENGGRNEGAPKPGNRIDRPYPAATGGPRQEKPLTHHSPELLIMNLLPGTPSSSRPQNTNRDRGSWPGQFDIFQLLEWLTEDRKGSHRPGEAERGARDGMNTFNPQNGGPKGSAGTGRDSTQGMGPEIYKGGSNRKSIVLTWVGTVFFAIAWSCVL